MYFKGNELQLVGNSIGRINQCNFIFPRVTKTSNREGKFQNSLFVNSFNKKLIFADNKNQHITNSQIGQLSPTVDTSEHNTGFGWNQSMRGSSRKFIKKTKIVNNSEYKYENKFFPKRNISLKLKYVNGLSQQRNRKVKSKFLQQENNKIKYNNIFI